MTEDNKRKAAAGNGRLKRPLKRLVSCGTCKACTRSECGECINCLDKLKFGGQGIRKQCCINRRCLKLKQNMAAQQQQQQQQAAAAAAAAAQSDTDEMDEEKLNDMEQQLFWTAVAGCMKLNNGEAPDAAEVESMRSSSPVARGSSPTHSTPADEPGLERPLRRSSSNLSEESAFCFKLASLLASNGTLASKPIAVRLMSNSQQPAWVEMLKTAQQQDLLRATTPALSPGVA